MHMQRTFKIAQQHLTAMPDDDPLTFPGHLVNEGLHVIQIYVRFLAEQEIQKPGGLLIQTLDFFSPISQPERFLLEHVIVIKRQLEAIGNQPGNHHPAASNSP